MTDVTGKTLDLQQLHLELQEAGFEVGALGVTEVDTTLHLLDLHTYDGAGNPAPMPAGCAAIIAAHVPASNDALHSNLVATLQSTVGVTLGNLTQAQRLALVAGLLYKAGAIDRTTLAIRPLNTWLI